MRFRDNLWFHFLLVVCALCLITNVIVFCVYGFTFNRGTLNEVEKWNLFLLAFNGLITAILTVVNIYVFVQINKSIENNNETRQVRDVLQDAQTILAKMRFDEYTFIKDLINDIKVSIYSNQPSTETIKLLRKKLMEIDNSFLYQNQNLYDEPFLRPMAFKLVGQLDEYVELKRNNKIKESHVVNVNKTLSDFLNLMEFYIIDQLVRSKKVEKYISDNQDEMDCTISCIYDYAKELIKDNDEDNNLSNDIEGIGQ